MLGLLPLLTFVSVFIVLGNRYPAWGWRRTFVRSFVLLGSYMVLATEGLSLVQGITRPGLFAVWSAPFGAGLIWGARRVSRAEPIRLPKLQARLTTVEWVLVAAILAIAGVTAIVAWVAPPNTWDSLTYHMSRVAHWAQDRSVRPYATGIERQNFMSPVAEMGMLQVYVLDQGDRWVNFIEWMSMVVSTVAATLLAKDLGANRSGQLFSAAFVASLPMGIAQASSTMTDYVVAAGVIAVACEALHLPKEGFSAGGPILFASLAAGLTLGAKPTGLAFLLPLAVYIAILLVRRAGLGQAARSGVVALGAVLILNAGYLARNVVVYGVPAGGEDSGSENVNQVLDFRVLVSNLLRNASLHAGTPSPYLNKAVVVAVTKVHEMIGLDTVDPRTTVNLVYRVGPPSTSEVRAGNPAHAVLILLTCILLVLRRDLFSRSLLGLALAAASSAVVFSAIFKFTIFGSRYHLPFFVLFAPVVGCTLARRTPSGLTLVVAFALCLASWPWLVHLDPRPLIDSGVGRASILGESRDSLYLELDPNAKRAYLDMASVIQARSCLSVGIMLSGGAAEYPLWAYLGAPRPDLRLEWIVAGTPSARFADATFEPCAVVCDASCSADLSSFRGLDQVYSRSGYRVFLGTPRPAAP